MINDSIILVSAINRARSSGAELTEAILIGTRERLRPVLLTTLTTIGGLTPLLFERSLQAQLVQPLAITLIFGLLFSLFLVLFFVPAVLGIGDDMKQKFLRRGPVGPEHTAESHACRRLAIDYLGLPPSRRCRYRFRFPWKLGQLCVPQPSLSVALPLD